MQNIVLIFLNYFEIFFIVIDFQANRKFVFCFFSQGP